MHLSLHFVDRYSYDSRCSAIPVVAIISSPSDIELADKIDLRRLILKKISSSEIWYGRTLLPFGIPSSTFMLRSGRPIFRIYDVLSDDDGEELPRGEYSVEIELALFRRINEDKFERIMLTDHRSLLIG